MLQASSFRKLNCYISENTLGFAEICRQAGYPTDLGGYYLRRLVKDGYIEKTGRGQYTISAGGKQQLSLRYGKAPFYLRPA
jgi:DNA-binding PadR family transcriptional regulator